MKRGESSSDPHPEFMDFGIDRAEGGSLLAEEEDNDDTELKRRACIEWCTDHGIEYVEACAINEVFDKCKHNIHHISITNCWILFSPLK